MPPHLWAAAAAALVLSAVHVVAPSMRFLAGTPRSVWLSIAGGVAVAYVFVHLLPELAAGQADISRAVHGTAAPDVLFAERHVYLIALAGLTVFYGLDKLAKRSRGQVVEGEAPRDEGEAPRDEGEAPRDAPAQAGTAGGRSPGTPAGAATSRGVFWTHMGSFGIYNALVGYLLLHRETPGLASLAFFAVAMALHFLVTDFGLNEDHKTRYRDVGRWVLVVAVFVGVTVGAETEIPKPAVAVLVAFLAGGVILNVLKEEVPSERRSRFWAFGVGLASYAALLLTF